MQEGTGRMLIKKNNGMDKLGHYDEVYHQAKFYFNDKNWPKYGGCAEKLILKQNIYKWIMQFLQ